MRYRILLAIVLSGFVGLAAACAAQTVPTPSPTLSPTAIMTHGPLTGAVTANSAQIWVRTNEPARVKIQYAPRDQATAALTSNEMESGSESDLTLRIPLENLQPSTLYDVTVLVNGSRQDQKAHFKTFPPESESAPFKMVVLTDFGYHTAPLREKGDTTKSAFESAQAEDPDLVFIGGDFDHRDPKLLPDKRLMFQDLYRDDAESRVYDFARFILHQFPLAHQWDDHDYGGDNSDRHAVWRETARRVFEEYFPAYPTGKYGIYQSFRYGKDVELFVLDGRSQRDSNQMEDTPEKSMLNGEHHPDGQLQWLLDGLKNSNAVWKLVMTPSAMNNSLLKSDSWARFSHERDTILNFIRDNEIGGVIFIAGDLHGGALDNGHNARVPSVVVPSANLPLCMTVPEHKLGDWSNGVYGSAARKDKKIPCAGYGVVTIDGERARIEIKDSEGDVKLEMDVRPEDSFTGKP